MASPITSATHRASFAIGDERAARRVVDLLQREPRRRPGRGRRVRTAGWAMGHQCAFRGAARSSLDPRAGRPRRRRRGRATPSPSTPSKPRTGSPPASKTSSPSPPAASSCMARHDRARVPANKLGIEIEAALAFGTGHHGTTRGCLLLLDGCCGRASRGACSISGPAPACSPSPRPRRCGGGCWRATSIRSACSVARDNARLNGVGNLVEAICATGFSAPQFAIRGPFDLVLANILANPLRQMATPMAAHLAPSALVILSGLLPHQAQGVIAAYRARGLILRRHLEHRWLEQPADAACCVVSRAVSFRSER